MKNNVAGNCQSVFLKKTLQFCFLTVYYKTSMDVGFKSVSLMAENCHSEYYNICNGDTEIIRHARILQYKTRNESLQRH